MSIYFDNAATSFPKPESVYQAVDHAMREVGVSPGRGGHRRSLEAARLLFRARESIAGLFSIPDSSRIVFTQNATEALNMALRGTLNPGDHVITTSMEHNSMLRPLYLLRQQGVEFSIVEADRHGYVDPDDVRRAIRGNTRMVAVSHVSNVSGTVQPIGPIAAVARNAGALFLLDAAQSAGNIHIDVNQTGIDLMAVPGHKGLLGPQGTGFLYAAASVPIRPLLVGGTGGQTTLEEQPESMPEGFEAGTHNLPGIAGLLAGVEFVSQQGVSAIGDKERDLVGQIAERLSGIDGINLYGRSRPESCGGLLSFTVDNLDSSTLAFALDNNYDIAVRPGLHCSPLAHRSIGTFPGGTVRVSPGYFNNSDEVAIFCDAVIECINCNN
jgi:cysteine desulfurase / selenocysteine lyase